MKSKFFQETGFSDESKKELSSIARLSPTARQTIINWFKQLKQRPRFDKDDVRKLSVETGEPAELVASTISLTSQILQRLGELGDSTTAFIEDVRQAKLLKSQEECDAFGKYFEDLSAVAQSFHFLSRIRGTEYRGVPALAGASMAVAIRPVYGRDFEYGTDDVTTFNLNPITYVPVATIELELSGKGSALAFQLNSDNFDRFLSDLLILQGQMKQMAEAIKVLGQQK